MVVVLGGLEDRDGIRWGGHVAGGVPLNLLVDPANPDYGDNRQKSDDDEGPAEDGSGCFGLERCR